MNSFLRDKVQAIFSLNYNVFGDNNLTAPSFAYFETEPGVEERLPYSGYYFVTTPSGGRVVLALRQQNPYSFGGYYYVYYRENDKAAARMVLDALIAYTDEHNIYKNKVLLFSTDGWFGFFGFMPGLTDYAFTWEELILKPELKETVRFETEDFLLNLDRYRKAGMPTKRGVLLAGPPGTGKTMINKILVSRLKNKVTVIVLTAKSVLSSRDVGAVYETARYLSPGIVMLEDLDMLGGNDRYGTARREILNELLNQLDGVRRNGDLLTLGTTNKPEVMDKALLRAGRFDTHVFVDLPDYAERKDLLVLFTRKDALDKDVNLEAIANTAEGFSPARLKELVTYTRRLAVAANSFAPDGRLLLTNAMFEEAFGSISKLIAEEGF